MVVAANPTLQPVVRPKCGPRGRASAIERSRRKAEGGTRPLRVWTRRSIPGQWRGHHQATAVDCGATLPADVRHKPTRSASSGGGQARRQTGMHPSNESTVRERNAQRRRAHFPVLVIRSVLARPSPTAAFATTTTMRTSDSRTSRTPQPPDSRWAPAKLSVSSAARSAVQAGPSIGHTASTRAGRHGCSTGRSGSAPSVGALGWQPGGTDPRMAGGFNENQPNRSRPTADPLPTPVSAPRHAGPLARGSIR
jgi:hypothetical protein